MPTAVACRARAAENELQAASAALPHQRERYELSAKAWNIRADMLEQIGRVTVARRAGHRERPDEPSA